MLFWLPPSSTIVGPPFLSLSLSCCTPFFLTHRPHPLFLLPPCYFHKRKTQLHNCCSMSRHSRCSPTGRSCELTSPWPHSPQGSAARSQSFLVRQPTSPFFLNSIISMESRVASSFQAERDDMLGPILVEEFFFQTERDKAFWWWLIYKTKKNYSWQFRTVYCPT